MVPAGSGGDAVEPRLGQPHGVGDGGAGLLGHGRDEADRTGRQLTGQVVVDRSGLLAAAHHVACAAEHLTELGEDLAQVGHVEVGPPRRSRTDPTPSRSRGPSWACHGRGRLPRRSRRAGQPCFNGTHRTGAGWTTRVTLRVNPPCALASEATANGDSVASTLTVGVVNRRISTVLVALVPIVAFGRAAVGGDRAVRVAGSRPDVRHPRRGRGQGGRRHRGHRRPSDVRAPQHDHGLAERRADARVRRWRCGCRAPSSCSRAIWSIRRTSPRTRSTRRTPPTSSARRTTPSTPRCPILKYPMAVTVETVTDPGPSAGKLQPGDAIDMVNNTPVANLDEFTALVKNTKPGDQLIVDYRRKNGADRHDDDHPGRQPRPRPRLSRRRRAGRAVGAVHHRLQPGEHRWAVGRTDVQPRRRRQAHHR